MDFYSRQVQARTQTRWLVAGFFISIAAVAFALDAVLFTVLGSAAANQPVVAPLEFAARNPGAAFLCTLVVVGVIGFASIYKSLQLRAGGGVVARSLGGVRIERDTADVKRKRLLNVVEEMAIASGVPVPEVYVLEQETAINAFAAGHTAANAAVTVTQGALDHLNRDELQGVIAHEFSHVLNGDMRLNVELMGWLFGLFAVALIGRTFLRIAPRSRRSGGGGIMVAALAVMVLGYVGLFCARILQAAVSRQRERLADASGVQFTRNPDGLKGALIKIAGLAEGSTIGEADAEQVAHMLFAPGLSRFFATHPPLAERIRSLDPQFDVRQLPRIAAQALAAIPAFDGASLAAAAGARARDASNATTTLATDSASNQGVMPSVLSRQVAAQVGQIETVHIEQARAMRLALPEELRKFVQSSGRARAVVLALLLSREAPVRERQLTLLARSIDAAELTAVRDIAPVVDGLAPMLRLPALLQVFPDLRRLTQADRQSLLRLAADLIHADARIDVFEFCLAQLLATLLRDELEARVPHGNLSLADAQHEIHVLFATLARFGAESETQARMAYEAGMVTVFPMNRPPYAVLDDWPRQLGEALRRLEQLHPFAKQALIEGLVKTIAQDDILTVAEAELLRTVCANLHCPLPPLLPSVDLAS